MTEFKVWADSWNDRESAHAVFAASAKRAAELFVEGNFASMDYPKEQEVSVLGPDGRQTEWVVEITASPCFTAAPAKAARHG